MLAVCDNEMKPYPAMKNSALPKLSDVFSEADKKSYSLIVNREKELGIYNEKKQEQKKEKEHKRKPVEVER